MLATMDVCVLIPVVAESLFVRGAVPVTLILDVGMAAEPL